VPWSDILSGIYTTFGPGSALFLALALVSFYLWREYGHGKDEHIKYLTGQIEVLRTESKEFAEQVGQDRAREMRTIAEMANVMKESVNQNRETLGTMREQHRDYLMISENQRRDAADERKQILDRIDHMTEKVVIAIDRALVDRMRGVSGRDD